MSHELAYPGRLPYGAGRLELGCVRFDVQDWASVDGVEALHCQLEAGDFQQGADRDAEVVRANWRVSTRSPSGNEKSRPRMKAAWLFPSRSAMDSKPRYTGKT
jgi:hypothetical protein